MPPKATKNGADALARLQLAHDDPALFLVQEVDRTNQDPVAITNLRSFMEKNDPLSKECLDQQQTLQETRASGNELSIFVLCHTKALW